MHSLSVNPTIVERHRPPRRRRPRLALGILLVGLLGVAASGGDGPVIEITDAVMPVPGSADETSVYLTITNSGDQDDQLLNADTEIAPMTHLHQTEIETSGRTSMTTSNAVDVAAGSSVRFAAGGRHLMLMGPKELQAGDTFILWLNFRHAGTVKTTVKVIDIGDLDL